MGRLNRMLLLKFHPNLFAGYRYTKLIRGGRGLILVSHSHQTMEIMCTFMPEIDSYRGCLLVSDSVDAFPTQALSISAGQLIYDGHLEFDVQSSFGIVPKSACVRAKFTLSDDMAPFLLDNIIQLMSLLSFADLSLFLIGNRTIWEEELSAKKEWLHLE